jgi:Uma2 family endonuclease
MSTAEKILPNYSYEEYCHWEGRWEIIEGIPYAMSPLPRLRHQEIAGNIYFEFKSALKNNGCNCKAFLPLDYKISENTVLQPDVLVVCNPEMDKKVLEKTPEVVVEVLSPSTMLKDRNSKFYIYQEEKIPYYIIIDVDKNEIEVYHLKQDGKYQLEKISTGLSYTFNLDTDGAVDVVLDNIWE